MGHTPGPWVKVGESKTIYCVGGDMHWVDDKVTLQQFHCHTAVCRVNRRGSGNANLALILAAPDLLAACKAVLANEVLADTLRSGKNPDLDFASDVPDYAEDCRKLAEVFDLLEAAIARAEDRG